MVLWVVDAHPAYQAGLNVESLAREGYSALIVKATQSLTAYTAPATFDNWLNRARAVGLVPFAYHWLSNLDPIGQADHFTRRIEAQLGQGLGLAYDNEDLSSPCSLDTLAKFSDRMRYNTGHAQALHYSGAWWARTRIGSYPLASLGLVPWDSKYVSGSGYASVLYQGVPADWWVPGYGGFARSKMLQFSSRGTAGGITANVDVNAFDGTRDELLALAAGADIGGTTPAMADLQTPEQRDAWNAANLAECILALAADPQYLKRDSTSGTGLPVPNGTALRDKLEEILTAAKAAGGVELTPELFGQLLDRVDQGMAAAADRLIAETRAALASVVEQALQPLRQGLGGFGAHLVEAAEDLDKLDDPPADTPAAG